MEEFKKILDWLDMQVESLKAQKQGLQASEELLIENISPLNIHLHSSDGHAGEAIKIVSSIINSELLEEEDEDYIRYKTVYKGEDIIELVRKDEIGYEE